MTWKVEPKGRRWALWVLYKGKGWVVHQTYLTLKGAETAAMILWDRGIFKEA